MSKNLVIVESPAKAKTINKILGRDFAVKSSVGHIRDLPVGTFGVDIENGFKPEYVVVKGKTKVVTELRAAAKEAATIYLATDPDREGEAIAWHLKEVLATAAKNRPFKRVQYNEITPDAVRRAFDHPGAIDDNRVDAQQARRVLDRLVGYRVSPMLWRRVRRGLSAGRVQSVALRLVCEREEAIRNFVPEAFWVMGARTRKFVDPKDPFMIRLIRIDRDKADVKSEEAAKAVLSELEGRSLRVASIHVRAASRRPAPPFITSTLQQAASTACDFSPSRTMAVAQKLYEGVDLGEGPVGLITYMRTDSVAVSAEAQQRCLDFVDKTWGREFRPERPNVYRSRSGAQGAHEAIRPTDVFRTPDQVAHALHPAERKLYELIWRRFVASQMASARLAIRIVRIEALPPPTGGRQFLFQATSSEVQFPGYMKVMDDLRERRKEAAPGSDEEDEEQAIPPLVEGESLDLIQWLSERKETKPPSRYSEASLVKALEQNGIGRPSTYAQILSTLETRGYVSSERRSLSPTELGKQVNGLLVTTLDSLFSVTFTASMETELDKVEAGEVQWGTMLGDFYKKFMEWMEAAREPTVDAKLVRQALHAVTQVTEWAPPHKHGRKTYDDREFVESVRKQFESNEKSVSGRQFEALLKTLLRYRAQIPGVEALLTGMGREDVVKDAENAMPAAKAAGRLDVLKGIELEPHAERFVGSLRKQAEAGRPLTPAQVQALDKVIMRYGGRIPNFEQIRSELGISRIATDTDPELGRIITRMRQVTNWNPPIRRGARTFDDKAFYESLARQYEARGSLSPKQSAVLRKMADRYLGKAESQPEKGSA
jgi:DNA topoisomerase-1